MSGHQVLLSLSRWVLIRGAERHCRHPARSAQVTPRWTCAGRAGAGHPGEAAPLGPWEPPKRGVGGALGETGAAPALWLVLGASAPLLEVWPSPGGHADSRPFGLQERSGRCWGKQSATPPVAGPRASPPLCWRCDGDGGHADSRPLSLPGCQGAAPASPARLSA